MKPLAAVDFGSNTVSYLMGRIERGRFTETERDGKFVRLGEGVQNTGRLSDASMTRALAWVEEIARRLHSARVEQLRCVGTEALRLASNRAEMCSAARAILGAELEIISGDEEARLTFDGVRWRYPEGPLAIVDIGGGSMELILAEDGAAPACWSLPLGSVVMTEKAGEDWPQLVQQVAAALVGLPDAPEGLGELTVVGGSGSTLAMLDQAVSLPTDSVVEGRVVSIERARELRDRVRSRSSDERTDEFELPRKRADIVVAVMAVLEGVAGRLGLPAIRTTRYSLRHGVLRSICAGPYGLPGSRARNMGN